MTRIVKLGRKNLTGPLAKHWAVQVDETWYEIQMYGGNKKKGNHNRVHRNRGFAADSGAGSYGGEIAGKTDKTDDEIDSFIDTWLHNYPDYSLMVDNCQAFAFEFIDWLTDGNYRLPHMLDSGGIFTATAGGAFTASKDGINIARADLGEVRVGPHLKFAGPAVEASAINGEGLHKGVFVDAEVSRAEFKLPVGGAHVGLNVNTGIGCRDGNLDVHAAGFGLRAGADGVGIDTPLGGVTACSVM